MTPKDPTVSDMGNGFGLSPGDINKLKSAYGCEDHEGDSCSMHVSGSNGTLQSVDLVDGCEILITAPSGYTVELSFSDFKVRKGCLFHAFMISFGHRV